MSTQVFLNGSVYSPADPFATAMVVAQGNVEWVGQDAGARSILDPSMRCTDLSGNLVAPAFALAALSAEPDQVADLLDTLTQAGYISANVMLTDSTGRFEQSPATRVRYYLPASKLNTGQHPDPAVKGIYCLDSAEVTAQALEFAASHRLNLVAVPADDSVAEEFLDKLAGMDSLARMRIGPCLGGLQSLDMSLIERAKDLNVSLGFSSDFDQSHNSYSHALSAGASAVLGSDPLRPPFALGWELMNRAVNPEQDDMAVSARAAFQSMTRAVYRAQGENNPWFGQLVPGAPAHCALWKVTELMVQTPDSRISAWSTDPRARTPLLPVLADDVSRPELLALYNSGQKLDKGNKSMRGIL